jgi:hypothetical protein
MTEEHHRIHDLRLKRFNTLVATIGALGVIASIYFGFQQLASQSKEQTQAIEDQWQQKYYDETLSIYLRATETAARIASLESDGAPQSQIEDAKLQFKTLYWGPMCVAESDDVESAMILFQRGIDDGVKPEQLEQLSLLLAHVCSNEIHTLYHPKDANSHYGLNSKILEEMNTLAPDKQKNTDGNN